MFKLVAAFLILSSTHALAADCIRVEGKSEVTLSGTLTFSIFAGPGYEDVTMGDVPEPAYILRLDEPQCFTGDDDLATEGKVSEAHLFLEGEDRPELWLQLKMLIGRHVTARGHEPFAAITGHHHAPVVMAIDSISAEPEDALWYHGTPATTVMAFYQALQAGQGAEAARFVVPEKREGGPLSAEALTSFYGNLKSYLRFIDLRPLGENEYEALYTYEMASGRFCNGRSVVRTTKVDGRNLIAGIEAKNGC